MYLYSPAGEHLKTSCTGDKLTITGRQPSRSLQKRPCLPVGNFSTKAVYTKTWTGFFNTAAEVPESWVLVLTSYTDFRPLHSIICCRRWSPDNTKNCQLRFTKKDQHGSTTLLGIQAFFGLPSVLVKGPKLCTGEQWHCILPLPIIDCILAKSS